MTENEQILQVLKSEFGWDLTDSLTKKGKELVKDTLDARMVVKNLTIPRVTNWRFWDDNRNNRIVGFIVGLITGIAIYACL